MLFGFLGLKFTLRHGRYPVVLLGCLVSLVTYSLMLINFPGDANNDEETDKVGLLDPPSKAVTLTASFLLGFADACFNTQVCNNSHFLTSPYRAWLLLLQSIALFLLPLKSP